jgi:hypothetical protein
MHNRPLARRWPVVSAQKQLQVKVLRSDRAERRRATPRDPLQVRKATHVTAPCGNNLSWRRDSNQMASDEPGAVHNPRPPTVAKNVLGGAVGHLALPAPQRL